MAKVSKAEPQRRETSRNKKANGGKSRLKVRSTAGATVVSSGLQRSSSLLSESELWNEGDLKLAVLLMHPLSRTSRPSLKLKMNLVVYLMNAEQGRYRQTRALICDDNTNGFIHNRCCLKTENMHDHFSEFDHHHSKI